MSQPSTSSEDEQRTLERQQGATAAKLYETNEKREMNAVASLRLASMGASRKRDQRFYFVLRRVKLRHRALRAVANYNQRRIECFRCFTPRRQVLELDHVGYWKDSVKYGHGAERSREAIEHPERFMIMCRRCHRMYDLRLSENLQKRKSRRTPKHRPPKGRLGLGWLRSLLIWKRKPLG
jgi:hypothetical protein